MTLTEIHAVLREALEALLSLHGQLPDETPPDTAFTIGEAAGVLSRAKTLVGRDINISRAFPDQG